MLSDYDRRLLRTAGWRASARSSSVDGSRMECYSKGKYSIANDADEATYILNSAKSNVKNRSTARSSSSYILYGPGSRIYILPTLFACADALVTKFHEDASMLDLSGTSYDERDDSFIRSNYMGGELYYEDNKFHYYGKYGHIVAESEPELYDKIDVAKLKQEEAERAMLDNLKRASKSTKHNEGEIPYHVWGTFYVNGSLKDAETLRKSDNYKFYGSDELGAINKARMLVRIKRGLAHYVKVVPGPDVHAVPVDEEPIKSSTYLHRKFTVHPKGR